ncbi:MAG: hypothetical protein PWQ79_868 [Thermococcaceae archaeon]|nr:hypothetical protein [Thermococcaceae archaeon]MDK2913953.1 hypothetical protein [Thermococcaceae archaeon]
MDDVRKWTFYMIVLVAGFATGIGTIGLFPQMWLKYGITGLAFHVVFLAIFTILAISETEAVMKSRQYFVDLYRKILGKPGMIMTIFALGVIFLSYYTANVGLSILSPFVGAGALGRLISKIVVMGVILAVISRAKEKAFLLMAFGSLFLIVLVPLFAVLSVTNPPKDAVYVSIAKNMLLNVPPITPDLIRAAAERAVYGVGLGFGFYLMLGSFLNERLNPRIIIGTGVMVQLILGLLSTVAIAYMITPLDPGTFLSYANGGEEQAIELMERLPEILEDYNLLLYPLALGLFMAGMTSILPTAEVDLQILQSILRTSRSKASLYLTGIVLLFGIIDSSPTIADMMLKAVTTAIFVTAIFELYPIINGRVQKPNSLQLIVATVSAVIFAVGFLVQAKYDLKLGGAYHGSLILALILVGIGILGEFLTPME